VVYCLANIITSWIVCVLVQYAWTINVFIDISASFWTTVFIIIDVLAGVNEKRGWVTTNSSEECSRFSRGGRKIYQLSRASTLKKILTCPFRQLTNKSTCPTQSFSCPKKLIKIVDFLCVSRWCYIDVSDVAMTNSW
jgi:hypothetical protein